VKAKAAVGRGGGDAVGETVKLHAFRRQLIHHIDKPLDGAPEPIELPDDQHITWAPVGSHLDQAQARAGRRRGFLRTDTLTRRGAQGIELHIERWFRC
jgi:hypothetical protein